MDHRAVAVQRGVGKPLPTRRRPSDKAQHTSRRPVDRHPGQGHAASAQEADQMRPPVLAVVLVFLREMRHRVKVNFERAGDDRLKAVATPARHCRIEKQRLRDRYHDSSTSR
jgi:hypothetical protein